MHSNCNRKDSDVLDLHHYKNKPKEGIKTFKAYSGINFFFYVCVYVVFVLEAWHTLSRLEPEAD